MTRETRRGRGDVGQVGGIEALPFGLLIFLVGSLIIVNVWAVVDAKLAVSSAAKESVRAYVEAPTAAAAPYAAQNAATAALAAYGRNPSKMVITPVGQPAFQRCARVTFQVSYTVPLISIPFIGGFGNGVTVSSTHSEIVDPFRDGVPGTVDYQSGSCV